jgi:hypothetical protein
MCITPFYDDCKEPGNTIGSAQTLNGDA